ncbi:MAG: hypothetical protein AB7I36_08160 [Rhodospirillaceae bacterium]
MSGYGLTDKVDRFFDDWEKGLGKKVVLATFLTIVILLLFIPIFGARGAEAPAPAPPPAAAGEAVTVYEVDYTCPTGKFVTVATNSEATQIAHILVFRGGITPDQFVDLLTKVSQRPAALKFLAVCLGLTFS